MVFTDIEGSTRLLERLGIERYAEALELHHRLLRDAFARHSGYEVSSEGDAFFFAFAHREDALAAAAEGQAALAQAPWPDGTAVRVRMGIHTGTPRSTPPTYVGMDVHVAARIMAAAWGGQVLVSDAARGDALPPAVRDLGLHRLKDLTEPRRLWQLGQAEFPPVRSLHRTNLPVQPTPLIGRDEELARLLDELRDGARLLTLTGPGGIGKTRLALQVAADLTDAFADGVWFVNLAEVPDTGLVEAAIVQALGGEAPLLEQLRDRRLLLVLDNFEHLLESAALVATILESTAQVSVLATSRERLSIAGEVEHVVEPLPEEAGEILFVERARRLDRTFRPDAQVRDIVRALDGLPLAIELAASRVKVLPAAELAERLRLGFDALPSGGRDLPARQRTLRRTMEWSYGLLEAPERELFARLGVFAGSFSLAAAEAVAEATIDGLASLVDKSLIRVSDGTFFMLATLRAYARERLDQLPTAKLVRERHADHVLEQIGTTHTLDAERLARIDAVRADLVTAIDNMHAAADGDREALLIGRPRNYWTTRGLLPELERVVDRALRRGPGSRLAQEWLVHQSLLVAFARGRYDEGVVAARELLELRRERNADPGEVMLAISAVALALYFAGAHDEAARHFEDALALARQGHGDAYGRAEHLLNYANLLLDMEELEHAWSVLEEARGEWEALGDHVGLAAVEHTRGCVAIALGRLGEAGEILRTALRLAHGAGDPDLVMVAIEALGAVSCRLGDAAEAAELLGVAGGIRDLTGVALQPIEQAMHEATLAAIRSELGDEAVEAALAAGRSIAHDDPGGWALARGVAAVHLTD